MQQTIQQLSFYHVLIKLLDWPFLLFLALIVFIWIFHKQLVAILSRNDILLAWGQRSIRLRELSDNLDREIDPIREELDAVSQAVEKLQADAKTPQVQLLEPIVSNSTSPEQLVSARERIDEALRSGEYRWRSIKRLAAIGGVSEQQALDILRSNPEVVFNIGKSGERIARLKSR